MMGCAVFYAFQIEEGFIVNSSAQRLFLKIKCYTADRLLQLIIRVPTRIVPQPKLHPLL